MRRPLRYAALSLALSPLLLLPRRAARRVGEFYGAAAHALLPGLRRRSREHLQAAFPSWPPGQVRQVARAVPRWIGRTGVDFLRLDHPDTDRLLREVTVEGLVHCRDALASGRGAIVVTGHFGNWELLAAWLARVGPPMRVFYHEFTEKRLNALVWRRRNAAGVAGLVGRSAVREAARSLDRGEIVGVLIDLIPRGRGVPVHFFGRPCLAAPQAALLAQRTGAPLLPAALWWNGHGGYRARFAPPLRSGTDEGTLQERVVRLTRSLTAVLEEQIREAPEQWPWFYERWRPVDRRVFGGGGPATC